MPVAKKLSPAEVRNQSVLELAKDRKSMEVMIGSNYYMIYPLPGKKYAEFMATMRDIWYKILGEKEQRYTEAVQSAKALAQNLSEIEDEEALSAASDLMSKLSESLKIQPLEFLSHPGFASNIDTLTSLIVEGCDTEDIENMDTPQLARLIEVCLLQNFMPFVRLASTADRIFREGA